MTCKHTISQGKEGQKGSWCTDCGEKVMDVETEVCKDCKHFNYLPGYHGCKKHMMRVTPTMHVTFEVKQGTCWEEQS